MCHPLTRGRQLLFVQRSMEQVFVGVHREGWSVLQEDEIYDKQFGQAFAAQALDPNDRRNVLRDDYALEIAGVPVSLHVLPHRGLLLAASLCSLTAWLTGCWH